jgi:ribose-phosphate pyrophosphokinase
VKGKTVVLIDDIVDTGGSLLKAAEFIKKQGASKVKAFCTHAVLSNKAPQRIQDSPFLDELIVTNSIPHDRLPPKITVKSCAGLIAKAVA